MNVVSFDEPSLLLMIFTTTHSCILMSDDPGCPGVCSSVYNKGPVHPNDRKASLILVFPMGSGHADDFVFLGIHLSNICCIPADYIFDKK